MKVFCIPQFTFLAIHSVDDNDNEEINELSRLQDPAYQEPQVGGSINGAGAQDKNSLNSPGDKPQVPTDQKESGSDALANITGFLKAKEGTSTDPGKNENKVD